jgi:ribosomal protein L39E
MTQYKITFRDRQGREFPVWVRGRDSGEARREGQRRHRNLPIVKVEVER